MYRYDGLSGGQGPFGPGTRMGGIAPTICHCLLARGGEAFSHIKQEEGPPTVTVVSSTRFRPTRLCPGIYLPANILGHGRHTMPSHALPVRETHACFPSTSYDSWLPPSSSQLSLKYHIPHP